MVAPATVKVAFPEGCAEASTLGGGTSLPESRVAWNVSGAAASGLGAAEAQAASSTRMNRGMVPSWRRSRALLRRRVDGAADSIVVVGQLERPVGVRSGDAR